ncbi:hypothetical protein [Winogradskyella vidalii]|uniref:hypothetical protein n=1 Tax=Winogradskyella vidalii TaxID=2615024 RepID=UPI0015C784AC|nr:hypothetical protein [Winogradskyella vidalii]
MGTLKTKIFDHDTDVDVTHKINSVELNNWIAHLNYVEAELVNFIRLCTKEFRQKLKDESIKERFKTLKVKNETMLTLLNTYANSRTHIVECEDSHCDMTYISEHESFRKSYLNHIEQYRGLKNNFFNNVLGD